MHQVVLIFKTDDNHILNEVVRLGLCLESLIKANATDANRLSVTYEVSMDTSADDQEEFPFDEPATPF